MLPETKKDSLQDLLNQEFILLPNPMYGTFEQAVYPQSHLSDEEKARQGKKPLTQKDFRFQALLQIYKTKEAV